MRDYVIVTDSASDLPKEILQEYDIPCLPLYYSIDGVIYGDEKNIEPHEFFELMRKGRCLQRWMQSRNMQQRCLEVF